MQFYYGKQMPFRIVDEIEFWKLQEEEHTVVIREALTSLEKKYVDALKKWEQALSETHQKAVSFAESVTRSQYVYGDLYQQVLELTKFSTDESMKFIDLCREIKVHSTAAKDNPIAKTILDHIISESEYFIGIARVVLQQKH